MDDATAPSELSFSYRPSLLGAPWEFRLTGDGIDWVAGHRSGHVPFRNIRLVRMSFKPVSMQTQRYITEIWAEGAPKLQIVSSSWKSLVEQERLDRAYSAFIRELHARIVKSGAAARFEQGGNPITYWPGLAVFAGVAFGLAWLTARALQAAVNGAAAFIGAFLLLFLWQGGNFFRRNKPGVYSPDAPPPELLPKG
jgi:hypothetical protein